MTIKIGLFDFTSDSELDFIKLQTNAMIKFMCRRFPHLSSDDFRHQFVKIRPSDSMTRLDAIVNFANADQARLYARRHRLAEEMVVKRMWSNEFIHSINVKGNGSQRLAVCDYLVNDVVGVDPSARIDINLDFITGLPFSSINRHRRFGVVNT